MLSYSCNESSQNMSITLAFQPDMSGLFSKIFLKFFVEMFVMNDIC